MTTANPLRHTLLCAFALVAACSPTPPAPADVADRTDAAVDAAVDAAAPSDALAPGGPCSFNDDCVAAERCECHGTHCVCIPGARGTGRAGLDPCASGSDCASALCVEGPTGAFLCTAECAPGSDCPSALPRCITVASVGSFCARDPGGDAGADDGGAGVPGCEGDCAVTDLAADFGAGRTGRFDRAQHGVAGTDGVYVEAHFGGDPACPMEGSRTPDRTLVVSGLRAVAVGTVLTEADGLRVTLLDFRGALTSAPLLRATAARATARYVDRGRNVSFALEATFPDGTVRGGFFAPHCDSLDGP